MAKQYFAFPRVFLNIGDEIGDDSGEGPGTGQSTIDPYPCSFADWQTMFSSDVNQDETIDFEDYRAWWINNNFGADQWDEFNSDNPLYPTEEP